MGKLIGFADMKEKDGKVLFLTFPMKNGNGECCDKRNVYGEDAEKITRDLIGREIRFNKSISVE